MADSAAAAAERALRYNVKYGHELGATIMHYEHSLETQRHALALDASGDWRAALGVLANVEEIKRRAFNGKEGDAHIPQVLHNIGVVYASKGEHTKAIDAYKSSLDQQRKITGDRHAGVASALTNLANAFLNLDPPRLTYAQELYEKALGIRKEVLSADDALIADTLHNLAFTHERRAGERERRPGGMRVHKLDRAQRNEHHSCARRLYWEALGIRLPVLGKGHMDTAATMFNLGLSLRNTVMFGRALWRRKELRVAPLELAKRLFEATLEAWREHLRVRQSGKAVSVARTGAEGGGKQGDEGGGGVDKEVSMDIEDVAACLQYLATVEVELENYTRALDLFEQQVEIYEQCFEHKGKFTLARNAGIDVTAKIGLRGEAMTGAALCMVRLGRLPEAIDRYKAARKVLRSSFVVSSMQVKKSFASNVSAKMVAMRIRSKAKTAARRSGRHDGGGRGQSAAARAKGRDEKNIDPRIMSLLKGVERAIHATARRHNQLVELEKKKEEEETTAGGEKSLSRHSSKIITRETSWSERKRRQSFKK